MNTLLPPGAGPTVFPETVELVTPFKAKPKPLVYAWLFEKMILFEESISTLSPHPWKYDESICP